MKQWKLKVEKELKRLEDYFNEVSKIPPDSRIGDIHYAKALGNFFDILMGEKGKKSTLKEILDKDHISKHDLEVMEKKYNKEVDRGYKERNQDREHGLHPHRVRRLSDDLLFYIGCLEAVRYVQDIYDE